MWLAHTACIFKELSLGVGDELAADMPAWQLTVEEHQQLFWQTLVPLALGEAAQYTPALLREASSSASEASGGAFAVPGLPMV